MPASPFAQVHTISELAQNLGCETADIERYAKAADRRPFYRRMRIPKRGRRRAGQFRTVFKAEQGLGLIQKNIAAWIAHYTEFTPSVQGFVQKRSTASNAAIHLGQPRLLHADIRDFFGSIREARVVDAFRTLGCRSEVAAALGALCTLNGRLPQGSSASPVVANLVCRHLDADLEVLAKASECRYSRYADDITISGRYLPPPQEVEAALRAHEFELRDGKCRLQYQGRAQYVTGLTIADRTRPRLPKAAKKRLRLELYYASRFGLANHLSHIGSKERPEWAINRLGGWISYMYSVEGEATKTLAERYRRVRDAFDGRRADEDDAALSGPDEA